MLDATVEVFMQQSIRATLAIVFTCLSMHVHAHNHGIGRIPPAQEPEVRFNGPHTPQWTNAEKTTAPQQVLLPGQKCPAAEVETRMVYQAAGLNTQASASLISSLVEPGHPSVGLYRVQDRLDIEMTPMYLKDAEQTLCITKLRIGYGLSHIIEIAKEFPPHTCVHQFALRHEREHEKIQVAKVQEANEYLKNVLRKPLEFQGTNAKQKSEEWQRSLGKYVSDMYDRFVGQAQKAFDASGESERLAQECGLDANTLHQMLDEAAAKGR
jgi:hypothetical protein